MARFKVLAAGAKMPAGVSQAYLLTDNWDDFSYRTSYSLIIFDSKGEKHAIGGVKIGQFAMAADQRHPQLPDDFDALDERFFSLGQDDSYYDSLNRLGDGLRDRVLRALRDLAMDNGLFEQAVAEDVTS